MRLIFLLRPARVPKLLPVVDPRFGDRLETH
jgi:hypothetical protein